MDYVKSTIAENFGGASHSLADKEHQFELSEVPDLNGKVAVVTGGSRGIGFGCTYTFLAHGIQKIFILANAQDAVDEALKVITEDLGADAAGRVTFYQCDMSDWKAVKETAEKISQNTDRIDILVNNAARGIMTYQLTEYGVDRHMAVNHFGSVVLTSHLLPILKKTASNGNTVRIVNLGSNAHQSTPSDCKFESLDELNQDLGPNPQYGRSKLAAMLYARWLNKHLTSAHPNILANSTHPGFVETKMSTQDIHEPYPIGGYAMSAGMNPFKKDQFQGCVSTVFCATKTDKSGQYVCPPAIPEPGNELAQNMELAENLMKLTKEVVKEKASDDLTLC
jgi:NAD(P)-dependent dehydrogenase (short-subunit alcohol dehydrogenase family)